MMKVIRVRDGRAYEEVSAELVEALRLVLAVQNSWPNSTWYVRSELGVNIVKLDIHSIGPLVLIEGLKVPISDLFSITHASGVYAPKAGDA